MGGGEREAAHLINWLECYALFTFYLVLYMFDIGGIEVYYACAVTYLFGGETYFIIKMASVFKLPDVNVCVGGGGEKK